MRGGGCVTIKGEERKGEGGGGIVRGKTSIRATHTLAQ